MALPTTGQITLAQIQAEFGGANPISLSEYYKGGTYVPNITANAAVPTSGAISVDNFHGAAASGGGGGEAATITPSSLYTTGVGTNTSSAATAVGSGGTVTGHAWTRVSGDATITINSPSSASTTFTATTPATVTKSATFKCIITFASAATAFDTVDATFDSGV